MNLGARVEAQPAAVDAPPWQFPKCEAPRTRRIRDFIEGWQGARPPALPTRRLLDIAFGSMQIMQDTIAELKLAENPPDHTVQIPRNACGFHEFWRAAELIALGRERAAHALAPRPAPAD